MLNSNKRSLAINTKSPEGLEVMEKLIRGADVLVENFAPGAMDRMGLSWDKLQEWNPRLIFGSVKWVQRRRRPWNDLKVYENVAQCAGGARLDHRILGRSADRQPVRPSATATPACTC